MRSRLAYEGINYNTYRNQIRKEMLISEVRNNEVRRRITMLPQEGEALAKQIWRPERRQHRAQPEPHPDPAAGEPDSLMKSLRPRSKQTHR